MNGSEEGSGHGKGRRGGSVGGIGIENIQGLQGGRSDADCDAVLNEVDAGKDVAANVNRIWHKIGALSGGVDNGKRMALEKKELRFDASGLGT